MLMTSGAPSGAPIGKPSAGSGGKAPAMNHPDSEAEDEDRSPGATAKLVQDTT